MQTLSTLGRASGYRTDQLKIMMKNRIPLTPPMVADLLMDGFIQFNQKTDPLSTLGIRFRRIAGQVLDLSEIGTRREIRQTLEKLSENGVFMSLGHGGKSCLGCGAVASKKKQIELAEKGQVLTTQPFIVNLLNQINPGVVRFESPEAEMFNAVDQVSKVLADNEFADIIAKKKITVVAAVYTEHGTKFKNVTLEDAGTPKSQEIDDHTLQSKFPKLCALRDNLAKGLQKAKDMNISLSDHYAHSIMVFDPDDIAEVMDESPLLVSGFSCVDARLQPKTPGNPRSFLGGGPNELFGVTALFNGSSDSFIIANDIGSIDYALGHVQGVNQIPNFVTVASTMEGATTLKTALMQNDTYVRITDNGSNIIKVSFDPKSKFGLTISIGGQDYNTAYTGNLYR